MRRFPHLDQIDEALKFSQENPGFYINWPKVVSNIRVQAYIDLEPLMKEVPIPSVEELDA